MLRKSIYLLLVVAMVMGVAFLPSQSVAAQRPQPPTTDGRAGGPPAIDYNNLPLTIQQANQLNASMSHEQAGAMAHILEAHMPAFKDIMLALTAQPRSTDGQPKAVDKSVADRLTAELNSIDAELALVLSADQLALYRAVMQPGGTLPQSDVSATPSGTNGYTDYCFYGAYESAYAKYYGYYGYYYAYYNWYILYYYGYSYYYAYDAYVYSYYGYLYSRYALDYAGPDYFSMGYFGMYSNTDDGYSYPYLAYVYAYYADEYQYYAYIYSYYAYYYDYYYTDYAYYAYVYNYYGWYYGSYYADIDLYYCYYYS
jgi:hypothetical protein